MARGEHQCVGSCTKSPPHRAHDGHGDNEGPFKKSPGWTPDLAPRSSVFGCFPAALGPQWFWDRPGSSLSPIWTDVQQCKPIPKPFREDVDEQISWGHVSYVLRRQKKRAVHKGVLRRCSVDGVWAERRRMPMFGAETTPKMNGFRRCSTQA